MKILLVHPGASYSTADVFNGYYAAFKRAGVEIVNYALDGRIARTGAWLNYNYRKTKKILGNTVPKPTAADVLYKAGEEIITRALRFDVDFVIVISAMYVHPDIFIMANRARLNVGLIATESPYDDEPQKVIAPYLSAMWLNERTSVEVFRDLVPLARYLGSSFDPERHNDRIVPDADTPHHDVVFVGTGFKERIELLEAIDWTGIDLGLYGTWDLMRRNSPLRRFVRSKDAIDNEEAVKLYRAAKIGLNLHRSSMGFGVDAPRIDYAYSVNPRLLELTACGAFVITDNRPEIADIYGDSLVTFTSPSNLADLVREFIRDDDRRLNLTAKAHQRVNTGGYTFDDRAASILTDIVTLLGG